MKRLQRLAWLLSIAFFVLAPPVIAQDSSSSQSPPYRTWQSYYWWLFNQEIKLPPGGKLIPEETPSGKIVPQGQIPTGEFSYDLELENTNDRTLTIRLLTILNPGFSNRVYAATGSIKYDNVQGDAYLEMWSCFPPAQPGQPERQYFSRTLGETGEMQKITGTSDWRTYLLPFDRTGTITPPARLEINLILPGHGTVYLRTIRLVKYVLNIVPTGWWSERTAPWIGGIGGPVIGCFGALLGMLAGKGKARKFVLATWQCLVVAGIFSLLAAVIAFATKQPYFVTLPFFIFGIVLTAVMGGILPAAKKRYDDLEIRRMASMDAMRG